MHTTEKWMCNNIQDCQNLFHEETGTSIINSLSQVKYKACIHPVYAAYKFNTVNIRPGRAGTSMR